ncbi:hypothetical protein pW2_251 [Bacillus phage pW2]|uniref:Uncharacterized protein n=1 Tax=Bacillus phage pW2 TaxID=2500559 RepID=A0A3Q9R7J9_9CAUD|nr:hypothetical protein PQE69_gp098 [Bacillus phage pW2]AZU99020.1 hypothetical protein pW2_251 [Bacillus phage pW2]
MSNTKTNEILAQVNERPFQVDYKENLSVAFKALEEIAMSLDQGITDELNREMSIIDKKIVDLEHTIEFVECNASMGYALFKKLQDAQRTRRIIKERIDERRRMIAFVKQYHQFKSSLKSQVDYQDSRQARLDTQQYSLRAYTELQPYIDLSQEQKAQRKIKEQEQQFLSHMKSVEYVTLEEALQV